MMSSLKGETDTYTKQMDQWVKSLGLPQHQPQNAEVETVLGFDRDALRERSSIELSEDAFVLARYAFYLQQKTNECKAFLRWSKQVQSTNRITGDDRSKLYQWVKLAELRIERIEYLTRRIELIGQSIGGLVRARYNEGSNR